MPEKLPYFPFYAGDWLSDEKLRTCSLAARGLWMDLLSLMHKNDRRGYLQVNGKPMTAEQLSRVAGCPTDEVLRLLEELVSAGVPSVTGDGIVFSRRMAHDEQVRHVRSTAGKKGGKARTAKFCLSKTSSKTQANAQANAKQNSDSDSDSDSPLLSSSKEGGTGGEGPPGFARFWQAYPRKTAKQNALAAWKRLAPGESLLAAILEALEKHKDSEQWRRGIITHPATWLNQRRWEDEVYEPKEATNANGHGRDVRPASRVRAPAGKYDGIGTVVDGTLAFEERAEEGPPAAPPAKD